MLRLRQGASPPRAARADDLGGLRGGAAEARSLCGSSTASMRVPASVSKTCLVRFDNNKYSVSASAVGRPVESPCLCRSHRDPPGRADRRRASALALVVARRFTTLGIMCRCSPASRALCAMVPRSRTGCCRPLWSASGASSPASDDGDRQMVEILAAVLADGLPAVEAACAEATVAKASIPPMSSSTSSPADVIPARRDDHDTRGADASTCAHRRLRPLRPTSGEPDPWNEPNSST